MDYLLLFSRSGMLLLIVLAVAVFTLTAIANAWALGGRGHWFIRALPLVVLISLAALVTAHDAVLVFCVQSASFFGVAAIARLCCGSHRSSEDAQGAKAMAGGLGRLQIGLGDLVLAFAYCAVMLPILARAPAELW